MLDIEFVQCLCRQHSRRRTLDSAAINLTAGMHKGIEGCLVSERRREEKVDILITSENFVQRQH